MLDPEQPVLPESRPQKWPESLAPDQEILRDMAYALDDLLSSAMHGNVKLSLEVASKAFLEKYYSKLPIEAENSIVNKRQQLIVQNNQDPTIRR